MWLAQQSNSVSKFQYLIILCTVSLKKGHFFKNDQQRRNMVKLCQNIFLWVKICKTSELRFKFSSVQSLSCVWLFLTPWTTACQASLSIINSQSFLKLISILSVMLGSSKVLGFFFQETILYIFCISLNYNIFMWLLTQIKFFHPFTILCSIFLCLMIQLP